MIDGAGGSENRFVVDGLDTTALRNGVSSTSVVTEFVEQVQVKSSGYNAEFRATTGGVISAITRSGTNRYSGEFGAYYSNNDWLGDIREAIRLNPLNQAQSQYTITPRTDGSTVEPTFTLGGPIMKDKMWFFAGYVPQFTEVRANGHVHAGSRRRPPDLRLELRGSQHHLQRLVAGDADASAPSSRAATSRPKVASAADGRTGLHRWRKSRRLGVPHQHPEPDDVPGRPLHQQLHRLVSVDQRLGRLAEAVHERHRRVPAIRRPWSDADRVQHRHPAHVQCLDERLQSDAVPGSSGCPFPEIPANLQQPSGYADSIANSRTVKDDFTRLGISTDATYYVNFKGEHTLKGGFQYERLGNDVLSGQQAPNIALSWNSSRTTIDVPARIVRGAYGYYNVSRSYTEGKIHSNNYGLFLQDAWTVSNRLTLNLGLRADQEDIPSYREENPGIHFDFLDKLAPRVGFAYDVKGDGRWKAYGSWGMFYDISKLEMPRGSFGADRWINYYWTLDNPNWPAIDCTGLPDSGCPGTFIEQVDSRHVSNGVGSEQLVDPDIQPIRAQEFTLGAEHQLARTMSLSVRYAHKWMDRTIEDVGIAVPGVGEVFYITNPGEGLSENLLRDKGGCPTCPNQPLPERVYDGLEFRLMKRLSNNWFANASYTFSRLHGNYSGLSSSDENGRNSPSVNRFFDGQYMSFDQTGKPIYGDLGTDRPHQFEVQAAYQFPWGTQVGGYYLIGSGLPQQQQVTIQLVPVFNLGRNSMGRTPTFSQTDLNIQQDVRFFRGTRITLEMNIINAFDQKIVTGLQQHPLS